MNRVSVFKCSRLISNRMSFHFSASSKFEHQEQNCETSSSENIRIYYGILTPQIRAVKILSVSTSVVGIASQPLILNEASNLGYPIVGSVCGLLGFFTFVTPWMLHWITKKYVTEIKFNSNTGQYTAMLLSFFLRKKRITFTPADVKLPAGGGIFSTFQVRGIHMYVEPALFEDPVHYARIRGFDKPLDLKLSSQANGKKNK